MIQKQILMLGFISCPSTFFFFAHLILVEGKEKQAFSVSVTEDV